VTGGVILALTLGADSPFWRGNGWSIVIQGGFLFLFDLLHALGIPGMGTPDPDVPRSEQAT
jgi:hypothetical protein